MCNDKFTDHIQQYSHTHNNYANNTSQPLSRNKTNSIILNDATATSKPLYDLNISDIIEEEEEYDYQEENKKKTKLGNSKISAASPIQDYSELDEYSTPIQNDRTKNKSKNQVTLTAEQLAIYKNTKSLLEKNPDLLRSLSMRKIRK
jgi:hypothetical protein